MDEVYIIHYRNRNNFWREAIKKEIKKIGEYDTFKKWEDRTTQELRNGLKMFPRYQEIDYHVVFDIKMNKTFTRKTHYVANGNELKNVSPSLIYITVVSQNVSDFFLVYSFNNLEVFLFNILNTYINIKYQEKYE